MLEVPEIDNRLLLLLLNPSYHYSSQELDSIMPLFTTVSNFAMMGPPVPSP